MRGKYERYQVFCKLIEQANGLPEGTTSPVDYDQEKLLDIIRQYSRAITVLQWGLSGAIGALGCEDETLNSVTKNRRAMPYYNFDWGKYYEYAKAIDEMDLLGCKPNLSVQPEAALKIFGFRRKLILPPEKKINLWEFTCAATWHTQFLERIIANWCKSLRHSRERAEEEFQASIEAARMVSLHGKRPDCDEDVDRATVCGEGNSEPADSDQ